MDKRPDDQLEAFHMYHEAKKAREGFLKFWLKELFFFFIVCMLASAGPLFIALLWHIATSH